MFRPANIRLEMFLSIHMIRYAIGDGAGGMTARQMFMPPG